MLYDLEPEQLAAYRPALTQQADFEEFWEHTLSQQNHSLDSRLAPARTHLETVDVFDVRFTGYGGDVIAAWLLLPATRKEPVPCVIEYCGYSFGRGLPHESLLFSAAGYAHLIMDNRGQGGGGKIGATADGAPHSRGQIEGFLTQGVTDPNLHYYRRLFIDAVRAIDVARTIPCVDPDRILLRGTSQGAATALAANALTRQAIHGIIADVPFLCNIRRGVELVDTPPYSQVRTYLAWYRSDVDTVFRTLSYFDAMNFAARGQSPALFSVAMMDTVSPPSTVYAAFNHYSGPKEIVTWAFNGHEGGGAFQDLAELEFLARLRPVSPR